MKVKEALNDYYKKSPFGEDGDISKETVFVYAGPYLMVMPNTDMRKSAITYHDLHHLLTGYSNSRIGEGEVGAWELGTDCWNKPIAVFYNLGGMATGLMYSPKKMYKAFISGCRQRNLYDCDVDELLTKNVDEVLAYIDSRSQKPSKLNCNARYVLYLLGAYSMLPPILFMGYMNHKFGGHS